ncbi:MAG: 4Fe-4S dicluster domain-containing protein [Candidatus Thiodiazotropha sp.]
MSKWNLIIDVARCENCRNCGLATKDEHIGNDFPGYAAPQPKHGHDWITIKRHIRGEGTMVDVAYLPTMCNHCDNAPCLEAAGDAVKKRDDGIVVIDPVKAKGRREIVETCPYGAISWNDELQLPQIWIFDAHLIDQGWQEPRCAQSCPTDAIKALKIEDKEMQELAMRETLEVLEPELGTRPRIYYRNLQCFTKCFIGGSLIQESDGVVDLVSNAEVSLIKSGATIAKATTDTFGEFKFDGLDPESGQYVIEALHETAGNARMNVELGKSRFVESIKLTT